MSVKYIDRIEKKVNFVCRYHESNHKSELKDFHFIFRAHVSSVKIGVAIKDKAQEELKTPSQADLKAELPKLEVNPVRKSRKLYVLKKATALDSTVISQKLKEAWTESNTGQ